MFLAFRCAHRDTSRFRRLHDSFLPALRLLRPQVALSKVSSSEHCTGERGTKYMFCRKLLKIVKIVQIIVWICEMIYKYCWMLITFWLFEWSQLFWRMLILFLGCGLPICCYCSSTRNTAKTDKTAKTAKTVKTANTAKTSLTDVFDSTPAIIEAIATTELANWTTESLSTNLTVECGTCFSVSAERFSLESP